MVDENDAAPLDSLLLKALASKQMQRRITGAVPFRAEPERRLVEELATPIVDQFGSLLGAVLVLRDVTDTRRQLREIEQLNQELEQRVKQRTLELQSANSELESFSYSVAHDLRAPLRSIDAFSRVLSEQHSANLQAGGLDHLNRIQGAVDRMSDLIDALLSLAGVVRSELNFVSVDVATLVGEIGEELTTVNPDRDVRLSMDCDVTAYADVRLLRTVLRNLLENAWKFTRYVAEPHVTVGCRTLDNMNTIYVRDNGAGFNPRLTEKLFQPFQRLHHERAFSGTGIGLAIVERAIRRLGGTVWADSQPGQGATFYFTLRQPTGRAMDTRPGAQNAST